MLLVKCYQLKWKVSLHLSVSQPLDVLRKTDLEVCIALFVLVCVQNLSRLLILTVHVVLIEEVVLHYRLFLHLRLLMARKIVIFHFVVDRLGSNSRLDLLFRLR